MLGKSNSTKIGPLRALTRGPGSLNPCQSAMVHRGKHKFACLKHSPPPETRETLKVLEELEKPDMGGMDPAVEKLRHEDFKFEASLGSLMSSRPAELQQGNFALKMLKKERYVLEVW